MKKLITILTACSISIAALSPITASADDEIKVYLDGTQLEFEVLPVIIDGTTFVPMRTIFEALGAELTWDENNKTILSVAPGICLFFTIDSTYMERNTIEQEIDNAPFISNGITLLPLRIVAECFGCDVMWDGNSQSIFISTTERIKTDMHSDGVYYVGEEEIRNLGTLFEMHDCTGYGALYNITDDSLICMGYFEVGNMTLGTLFVSGGSIYRGEFKDGQYNGDGTYYYSNGDIYTGEFVNGNMNGYGTYRWANGYIYEGLFVNGQPSTTGVYHW